MIISLCILSLFCFFIGAYPFTLYPLSLILIGRFGKSRRSSPGRREIAETQSPLPRISIALCAHNEEKSIGKKLRNLAQISQDYAGSCEILLYLDACTDRTAEIVRSEADMIASNIRLTVIEGLQRSGKSHGMTRLMTKATGEIVVFTDANVELDEKCLAVAANAFCDPVIGCICGNLRYLNSSDSATAEIGSIYWRFEEWLKRLESETGSTISADGSLFAIRRSLFCTVPDDIIDDMYTSMGVLLQGYRVIRLDEFRAYEMHTVSPNDEFRRKIRITCRSVNCYRLLSPQFRRLDMLTRYKIIAHKVLRWLTIFWLCLGTVLFVSMLALQGAFIWIGFLAIAAICLTTSARIGIRPFSDLTEILRAFFATGIGVVESYRGKRYQTWGIASSSRPS